MKISVKVYQDKVSIKITDFTWYESIQKLLTMLVITFRHISRFDIRVPKMMRLNGDIRIHKLNIFTKNVKNLKRMTDTILSAAEKTLWSEGNGVARSRIAVSDGDPGFEIEYGYDTK